MFKPKKFTIDRLIDDALNIYHEHKSTWDILKDEISGACKSEMWYELQEDMYIIEELYAIKRRLENE